MVSAISLHTRPGHRRVRCSLHSLDDPQVECTHSSSPIWRLRGPPGCVLASHSLGLSAFITPQEEHKSKSVLSTLLTTVLSSGDIYVSGHLHQTQSIPQQRLQDTYKNLSLTVQPKLNLGPSLSYRPGMNKEFFLFRMASSCLQLLRAGSRVCTGFPRLSLTSLSVYNA